MKKQQQPGKKLSRRQMQSVKGGEAPGIKCLITADCPNACSGNLLQGDVCLNRRCTYLYCP